MRSPTSTRTSSRKSSRKVRGRRITAALLGIITALALVAAPSWGLPTAETRASTSAGADWTAEQVAADGSVSNGLAGPAGNAVQAALALAAAGEGETEFDAALGYVRDNVEDYTGECPSEDADPGALGYVLLLADVAGEDPTSFGGEDLVSCLQGTRRDSGTDQGLYGASGPTFDGTFRQSLALLGLAAVDVDPHPSAVSWLADQQCDSGGWPSYRPDTTTACGAEGSFDPTAPNTNSTGLAAQAFAALADSAPDDPLSYLREAQNEDGGFGFDSASATDSNSTALVIQAVLASGEEPGAGAWVHADQDSPFTALRQLQLGCEAAEADRGAFAYQPDEDGSLSANPGATYGGLQGMASMVLPVETPRTVSGAATEPGCPQLGIERDAGRERIATSIDLALDAFPDGTGTVVIAHAYGYADALAGGPLAAQLGAPIVLSEQSRLPAQVADAVQSLEATDAVLLGGTAALSDQVKRDLEALGLDVTRVGGATRFHTAADIAAIVGGDEVYVTEGWDEDPKRGWPDAVSVSPLASYQQRPILLVSTDELPDPTAAALDGRSATIVGGEAAVSPEVEDAIADETGRSVARIAGETRFRTALAVSRVAREAGMDAATSWIATGEDYPDALTAGPAIAERGGVLMLVATSGLENSSATADYVHEVNLVLEELRVVGGEAVVPPDVVTQLEAEARNQR